MLVLKIYLHRTIYSKKNCRLFVYHIYYDLIRYTADNIGKNALDKLVLEYSRENQLPILHICTRAKIVHN